MRKIKNMEPVPKLKKRNSGTGSKINNKAFTLIELLVVITILAILATIGFLSFQSYNVFARDSVRLWNLKTLESSLWIQYVQSWNYALPDDSVNITASWTIIRKQWLFWKNALRTVWVSKNWSTDLLTQEYFDYSVWNNLQEYQLVAYLEWDETMVSPHLASPKGRGILWNSYANIWQMKSMWEDLWIVFSWWLELHKTPSNIWNDFDIREDNKEYTVKFSEWDEITSSWSLLFSSIYNHSKNLLKNKELAKLDDSLVLYFDMETTTQSWWLIVLKDLSWYWNHWICMDWVDISWNCWDHWPYFRKNDEWFNVMSFNWISDYVHVPRSVSLWILDDFTLMWKQRMEEPKIYSKIIWKRSDDSNLIFLWHDNNYPYWWVGKLWWSHEDRTITWKTLFPKWKTYSSSLVFTENNLKAKLFLNWALDVEEIMNSYNNDIDSNFNIWQWYKLSTNFFKWEIDEIRIYNRALSESEIKIFYGSTLKN